MAIQLYLQDDGVTWGSQPSSKDKTGRQLVPGKDKVYYHDGTGYTTDPNGAADQSGLDGPGSKLVNAVEHPFDTLHKFTNAAGNTHDAPPDPSKGPDAQAERDFATKLRAQTFRPGGVEQTVTPTALDQTQANQSRGAANQNLADLQGVASGATDTAADALLRQGTDQAARNAVGLAAAYSRQNPGMALRQGLAASNNAHAQAANTAAIQKANEQAQARGQIGSLADAMRGQDLSAATQNQNTWTDAAKANQAANLQQQQVNNQYQLGMGNLASSSTIAPINASIANQQIQAQTNAQNQQGLGGFLTGLGSAGEKFFSDRAAKSDVKEVSLADALGKSVRGVTYRYKPGIADGGEHAGVIAQDLEKALPGVVSKGSDGLKRVDTGHLALGLAGATAELAKRLKAMEARR